MRHIVCDDTKYIDRGKYVIIRDGKKNSVAKVYLAKRLNLRYFYSKSERVYIMS